MIQLTKSNVFPILFLGMMLNASLQAATDLRVKVVQNNPSTGQNIGDVAGADVCLITTDGAVRHQFADNTGATIFSNVPVGSQTIRAHKTGLNEKIVTTGIKPNIINFQQVALVAGPNSPQACNPAPAHDFSINLTQISPTTSPVPAGSLVTYQSKYSGKGTTVNNVVIRYTFPLLFKLEPGGIQSPTGVTCTGSFNTTAVLVTCNASAIDSSLKAVVVKGRFINTGANPQQQFSITVKIDQDNTTVESNENNNTANATTTVLSKPELHPDLTGSDTQAILGKDFAYSIKLTNSGTFDAPGAAIRLTLPSQATFVRFENNSFTCIPDGGPRIYRCTANIPKGTSKSVRMIAHPNINTDGTVMQFNANVDPTNAIGEEDENNNSVAFSTTTKGLPDLFVSGASDESFACLVGVFGCRICGVNGFILSGTVHNDGHGPSGAGHVSVGIPNGLSMYEPNDSDCPSSAPVLDVRSCGIGCVPKPSKTLDFSSIPPGGTHHFYVFVRESNVISGNYPVSFEVSCSETEEDTSNNETNHTVD